MKLYVLTIIILVILSLSCNRSTTEPNDDPIGYQKEIPWPSLANSPWPMYRCDPQNTGRSKFIGPKLGLVHSTISANNTETGITIGKENRLFYFSKTTELISSTIDGSLFWKFNDLQPSYNTPILANNGVTYFATTNDIIALDSTGKLLWKYRPSTFSYFSMASISLGLDGCLYFVDGYRTLTALNNDGTLKWKYKDNRFRTGSQTSMAFSPDGKILYIQGNSVMLVAFDIESKSVKWTFGQYKNSAQYNLPAVDYRGNIYIISNEIDTNGVYTLYSLSQDGNINWRYDVSNDPILEMENSPCIDKNGNIIFGSGSIYSVDYNGKLNWKYNLSGNYLSSPISCDIEGNIYFAASKTLGEIKVYALNKSGLLLWAKSINCHRGAGPSLSISSDGKLIVPTFRDKNFFVIK